MGWGVKKSGYGATPDGGAGDGAPRRPGTSYGTFNRGILRTIKGSAKRFVALAVICALGTALFVGLTVACVDLRWSADEFFDSQDLFDIRVISTLGLTDEDIEALAEVEGVESVEGGWTETVYTTVGTGSEKVDVKALSADGTNQPYLLEGMLPVNENQIAVTQSFLDDSGLSIGDTVTFRSEADTDDEDDQTDDEDSDSDDEDDDSTTDLESLLDDEESTIVFERKEYTIVGVVLDPMDISAGSGTMSFRSSGSSKYAFFVLPSCVTTETYTVAYVRVEGAEELFCYDDEYDEVVQAVLDAIEEISAEREAARGEEVRTEALATIDDAEAEVLEAIADAQAEIDDAQAEIDEAQAEIDEGQATIDDGYDQLESGEVEYEASRAEALAELADAQAQILSGYAELTEAELELVEAAAELADALEQVEDGLDQVADAEVELAAARAQLETAASMLTMFGIIPEDEWEELASTSDPDEAAELADAINAEVEPTVEEVTDILEQMLELIDELDDADVLTTLSALVTYLPDEMQSYVSAILELDADDARDALEEMIELMSQATELADGMVQVIEGEAELAENKALLEESYDTIVAAQEQVADAWVELSYNEGVLDASDDALETSRDSALEQLDSAAETLAESEQELVDGQAELDEGQAELDAELADALEQLADARDEVADIDDAVWYIQDRTSISSFSSVDDDAGSIEAIGNVIPVIFVIVALLISLTTMTRMVEEERTLIGLYKALGYGQGRILSKYALYALAAVMAGMAVGYLAGFIVLPLLLYYIVFQVLYAVPSFALHFSLARAAIALGVFGACIVGSTVWACHQTLRESPAELMRPKAPKAGSRILLERVGPLWRRLSFLNKVTARNLFRYKRRLLMTVVGIAGTTGLLVCGFGIRDTVIALDEWQYGSEAVNEFDLMVVTAADDLDEMADDLDDEELVVSSVAVYTDTVTLKYGSSSVSAQLIVVPDGTSLEGYLRVEDSTTGEELDVAEATSASSVGAIATTNAASVVGFAVGDSVDAQDSTLAEGTVEVSAIMSNYLGNYLIMTEAAYEEAFDCELEANCLLVTLSGEGEEQVALSEELTLDSRCLSVTSTQDLYDNFSDSVLLINMVVWIIIAFAAALSFTVVFTLSNTNISEREREVATIKVLGFLRREVHTYINKETIILTLLGVLVGMPLGYLITASLEWILKMPALYFAVTIEPVSYAIGAAIAIVFTLVINQMTNRTLDQIDMVGALKSAE